MPRALTKSDRELTLPLKDYLIEVLKHRHLFRRNAKYVFPSKRTHTKPLSVGSNLTKKVSVLCCAKFTFHDLRRTFSTTAAKQKVPDYIIKRLINHSIKSDVTSQFLVLDLDNLRKHMNAITRTFLELFGLKGKEESIVDASMYVPPSEVIQLMMADNYIELAVNYKMSC